MSFLPEVLPIRATNQYRRRDALAYVGLRFYLKNAAALRDNWASEISAEHMMDRKECRYHAVHQFKDYDASNDEFEYRILHMPSPNEVLAEVALLNACAECGDAFRTHPNVFSYILPSASSDSKGVFAPYYEGFKARHKAMAAVCAFNLEFTVVYTDIRKFYPSISLELAERVWNQACDDGKLPSAYRRLGNKILSDYRYFAQEGIDAGRVASLPTGPMFSHLIGNLVFREIDSEMAKETEGHYFRYVDDISFIGPMEQVAAWEALLETRLTKLGLRLHPDKRIETDARNWFRSAFDFEGSSGQGWMEFVGTMKRYLLLWPENREELIKSFANAGIRIRPLDYSEVAQERDYLERTEKLLGLKWLRKRILHESKIRRLIPKALELRTEYERELDAIFAEFGSLGAQSYERKRKVYRLRFLITRMTYLATPEQLKKFIPLMEEIPELAMAKVVFETLLSGDATNLLRYGPTAVQSAAQPLLGQGTCVRITAADWNEPAVRQAYSRLLLNGVPHDLLCAVPPRSCPMTTFSDESRDAASLFHSTDSYFREMACLRGLDAPNANTWALTTAFDRDEDLVFDMQQIMEASS